MKRLLSVFCCLSLLLPFLAASVMAVEDEPKEYVFTLLPETSFLSLDFDFIEDASGELVFYCEDIISPGVYDFYISSFHCVLFDDLVFDFAFIDDEQFWVSDCPSVLAYVDNGDSFIPLGAYDVSCFLDSEGTYLIVASDFASSFVENISSCVLIPVASSPVLSGIVTDGMISSVLDPMVSLIPVVVGALAIYIGIRKGISWLFGTLNGT